MRGDVFRHADELVHGDAFRADVRIDRGIGHGGCDHIRAEDGGGLLEHLLASVRERGAGEAGEDDADVLGRDGRLADECEEGGFDRRFRVEDFRRDHADDAAFVDGGDAHGQRGVVGGAGSGEEPFRDFLLKHQEHVGGREFEVEEFRDNDGPRAVGEIGDDAKIAGEKIGVFDAACIGFDEVESERDDRRAEIFGDLAVELDRGDVRAGCHEAARDGTESGTDLKDGLAWLRVGLVQDLRAELVVHKEILAEAFARRDAEFFKKRFEFGFDHSSVMVVSAATASAAALRGRLEGGGQQDGMRSGTQSPVLAGAFLAALASMNKESTFFYAGALDKVMPIDVARTVAFATLICAELFRAFAARSERISVFKLGLFSNRMMNASVGLSVLLLLAVIYIPGVNGIFDNVMISPLAWCVILPLAIVPFILNEAVKAIKNSLHK